MRRNEVMFIAVFSLILCMCEGCDKASDPVSSDKAQTTDNRNAGTGNNLITVADVMADNCSNHEDTNDYIWDTSEATPIILNGNGISVQGTGATVNGSTATITSAGTYHISGTLAEGRIIVDTADKEIVRIVLDGVDIACATNAPVYVKGSKKAVIILKDGSKNFIADGLHT